MLNPSKRVKISNSNYSPILYGCINTCRGKSRYNHFLVLLQSGCGSKFSIRRLTSNLKMTKYSVMQWQLQAGNIRNNQTVKVNCFLPEFSMTKIVTWVCNVDKSSERTYDMILGIDILTALVLDLNIS